MASLRAFIGFWGGAVALQAAAAFPCAEEAIAYYAVNEWFKEWGKLSYMKGHIPHVATSDICWALKPDLQWGKFTHFH
eukprot:3872382-Alexandrium_andersonii.AAC.1